MVRRIVVCTLLFLVIANASFAAKRRAVLPGVGRCLYGPLADDAFVASVALDATDVYFIDDFGSSIGQVPRNGGFITIIGGIADPVLVRDMAVDDTTIYVTTIRSRTAAASFRPARFTRFQKTAVRPVRSSRR